MNLKLVLKFFLCFCIFLLISACGKKISVTEKKISPFLLLKQELSAPRNLTETEIAVGKRVCSDLEFKRINFPSTHINLMLPFLSQATNCNDDKVEENKFFAQIAIQDRKIIYVSDLAVSSRFEVVVTDEMGDLSFLCGELSNLQTPLNTQRISNSEIREFIFQEGTDSKVNSVYIVYGKKDVQNKFLSYKIYEWKVLHTSLADPSNRGLLIYQSNMELCSTSSSSKNVSKVLRVHYVNTF